MRQGYVKVKDGDLFYETAGEGEALVFIHGNFNDHRVWEEQLRAFASDYRVVGYDLRGYGQSSSPLAPFSNIEDLKMLMDALKIPHATLIGSSMGGGIALDFALAYPDRVRRIILAAPSVSGRAYPASMLWQGIRQHVQARLKGREKAIESFIANPFWQYFFPSPLHEKARRQVLANVRHPGNFCRFSPKLSVDAELAAIGRLEELGLPVLIVIGGRDHRYNRETAEILHARMKNSMKIVMPNCGHLPFIEEPDRYNSHMAEFLAPPLDR